MGRFVCANCGYKMDLEPGKKLPGRCPYCSKEGALDRVKSAQQLIDDVCLDEFE